MNFAPFNEAVLEQKRSRPGNARVQYQEHPVPGTLRRHLACLWRLEDTEPTGEVQTIYPDGCCELIVHLGQPPHCWDELAGWHVQARTLFAAQRLSAVRLRSTAPMDCLGIRLRPEVSCALGPEALRRGRERILDLASIDTSMCRALRTSARRFAAGEAEPLWRLLSRRIAAQRIDATIAGAVAALRDGNGRQRIDSVARAAGLGLRSLQTRFRREVGLTPKEFARLMRLRATLRALDADQDRLSVLAVDSGFSDQSHATRELRRFTGLAPGRLRAALRADRGGDAAMRLASAFLRGRAPNA